MPVYNSSKYLNDSIESILNQTYKSFEFIIIDDQSTDESLRIIHSYSLIDNRIVPLKNLGRKGCYAARNLGIRRAKGKYIAVMDSDDISKPDRFYKQIQFLEKNPHISICGTWMEFLGSKKGIYKTLLKHEQINDVLFFNSSMAHATCMMKREIFSKLKLFYNEDLPFSQDYDFFCESLRTQIAENIPEPLYFYRSHPAQISTSKSFAQKKMANTVREKNLKKVGINFTEERLNNYFSILFGNFIVKNFQDIYEVKIILDELYIKGKNAGYGILFIRYLKKMIWDIVPLTLTLRFQAYKILSKCLVSTHPNNDFKKDIIDLYRIINFFFTGSIFSKPK